MSTGPVSFEPRGGDHGGGDRVGVAGWFQAVWAGEVPLARAFWEYAIVYGSGLNLLMTIAAFALISTEAPSAVAMAVFFLPVPYNLLMVVGVWRSAGRYRGPKQWADLARGAILLWVIAATAI